MQIVVLPSIIFLKIYYGYVCIPFSYRAEQKKIFYVNYFQYYYRRFWTVLKKTSKEIYVLVAMVPFALVKSIGGLNR